MRKTNLDGVLALRIDGIHLAPFEQEEIGPEHFGNDSEVHGTNCIGTPNIVLLGTIANILRRRWKFSAAGTDES